MRTNLQELVYMNSEPRIQRARTQQVLGLNEGLMKSRFFPSLPQKINLGSNECHVYQPRVKRDDIMQYWASIEEQNHFKSYRVLYNFGLFLCLGDNL